MPSSSASSMHQSSARVRACVHACARACWCVWVVGKVMLGRSACAPCAQLPARYPSRHMRVGVYEYTKASSAAISKIADAIAPLTSFTGAIMEVINPSLI